MKRIGELYQSGDWKGEKHVPVIHAPETVKPGQEVEVKIIIGEEIAHPNTFEHNIAWVKVYFLAEGTKFPVEIASSTFSAHGEFDLFTSSDTSVSFATKKSGTIIATSYCNIHGLWENSKELTVEA